MRALRGDALQRRGRNEDLRDSGARGVAVSDEAPLLAAELHDRCKGVARRGEDEHVRLAPAPMHRTRTRLLSISAANARSCEDSWALGSGFEPSLSLSLTDRPASYASTTRYIVSDRTSLASTRLRSKRPWGGRG